MEEVNKIIDEIEDLSEDMIKEYLKDAKIISTKEKGWYKKPIDPHVQCRKSLYLIPRETMFRRIMYNLQKHKYFDRFIMLLIFLSSLKLATDTYLVNYPPES